MTSISLMQFYLILKQLYEKGIVISFCRRKTEVQVRFSSQSWQEVELESASKFANCKSHAQSMIPLTYILNEWMSDNEIKFRKIREQRTLSRILPQFELLELVLFFWKIYLLLMCETMGEQIWYIGFQYGIYSDTHLRTPSKGF